jgi:hypothetical protein
METINPPNDHVISVDLPICSIKCVSVIIPIVLHSNSAIS